MHADSNGMRVVLTCVQLLFFGPPATQYLPPLFFLPEQALLFAVLSSMLVSGASITVRCFVVHVGSNGMRVVLTCVQLLLFGPPATQYLPPLFFLPEQALLFAVLSSMLVSGVSASCTQLDVTKENHVMFWPHGARDNFVRR